MNNLFKDLKNLEKLIHGAPLEVMELLHLILIVMWPGIIGPRIMIWPIIFGHSIRSMIFMMIWAHDQPHYSAYDLVHDFRK